MSHLERIVVLVDMDCFYCQVEENLDPNLRGKPMAVVQYNAWRGGGIIAVNYPARDCGVTRHMRGEEAKQKCPEIQLVRVPNVRGKADLTKYREAGKRVAEVLQCFCTQLERASVDEAYLDITESVQNRMKHVHTIHPKQLQNTHIVGHENVEVFLNSIYSEHFTHEHEIRLAWGAVIAEEIRAAVLENTGYKCSAGIAHNKILAKLVAGIHKPNQQTILPHSGVPILFKDLPIRKIRSLGGKFGNDVAEKLDIKNMGELYNFSERNLAAHFDEKTANWLYNIARGIDNDPVTIRLVSKSIGCCKKFPGRTTLTNTEAVKHWLNELAIEIAERLEKDSEENNRKAKQMVVNFANEVNKKDVSGSRSHTLHSYDADRIVSDAFEIIKKNCQRPDQTFRIKFLGISVGKFEDITKNSTNSIAAFFHKSTDEVNITHNNLSDEVKVNETKLKKPPKNTIATLFANYTDTNKKCDTLNSHSDLIKSESGDISCDSKLNEPSCSYTEINSNDESDSDSITEELQPPKNLNTSSFFNKYIEKMNQPTERNFDTAQQFNSKIDEILDEEIEMLSQDRTSPRNVENSNSTNFNRDNPPQLESNSHVTNSSLGEVNYEICPECTKQVPLDTYMSHLDYHFALKIVRSEVDLYKPAKMQKPPSPKIGSKRKSISKQCMTITSFLVPAQKVTDEPEHKEVCPECGKSVGVDDFASHLDYHMAKRIHMEINNIQAKPSGQNNVNKKNGRNIAIFFKST